MTDQHAFELRDHAATTLRQQNRLEEAAAIYRECAAAWPGLAVVHFKLGNTLAQMGQYRQAMNAYRAAMRLHRTEPEETIALGQTLADQGRAIEAAAAFELAIEKDPQSAAGCFGLGNAYREMGLMDESIAAYERTLTIERDHHQAINNLANTLKECGRIEEAIAHYRRAAELSKEARVAGNVLYTLHFHPDYDRQRLADEHEAWRKTYADSLESHPMRHSNDRSPDRRLRVGYVSPDLREHPVGRFMQTLLAHHRHDQFEVFCYADHAKADATTARLRSCADHWRDVHQLSDADLAKQINDDRIDILVDLAMHTANNRLLVLARKPAPVQMSYLAYCSTTGLKAIDWRLSDPYLDPPGAERFYSEKTLRLPSSYWCYEAPADAPPVSPPSSLRNGFVTFGSLNNFAKISRPAIDAWASILQRVPNSRLILHAHEGSHRQRLRDLLASHSLDPNRLEFVGFYSMSGYLSQFARIDVGLDPFPYGGGHTTFDALWMGVPVVTLAGRTGVGRGGVSILSNLGKPQWIANSIDSCVDIATSLARDIDERIRIRNQMRGWMLQSPLMDAASHARDIESAYRFAWRAWCDSGRAQQPR